MNICQRNQTWKQHVTWRLVRLLTHLSRTRVVGKRLQTLTNHDGSSGGGSLRPVSERSGDREVPVKADDKQVQHRGVAGQIV